MEMAFLNAVLKSPQFPPLDPWLSGFAISYYYFGYVMMGVMTQFSHTPPSISFEIYGALIFSLTAMASYGLVYNLISEAQSRRTGEQDTFAWQPVYFGFLGSMYVVLMGNLEGLIEAIHSWGILPEDFFAWLAIKGLTEQPVTGTPFLGATSDWWWWRASRVVWDRNLIGEHLRDPNITEFPFFSFLLGDNHPHVLNLPFVLLALALALNILLRIINEEEQKPVEIAEFHLSDLRLSQTWRNPIVMAFGDDWMLILLNCLCLGALGFLNTWDFPIYLGLVVLGFGIGLFVVSKRLNSGLIIHALGLALEIFALGVLLYIYFYISFSSQAGGFLPYIFTPTRLTHFLIMFGTFAFIIGFFLIFNFIQWNKHQLSKAFTRLLFRWIGLSATITLISSLVILAVPSIGFALQPVLNIFSQPFLKDVLGSQNLWQVINAILLLRLQNPWLFILLTLLITLVIFNMDKYLRPEFKGEQGVKDFSGISPSFLFVCLLILIGLTLTFVVEFVYVRDIFGSRMNTIFKFYYQAWVLFAIASAYAVWWILNQSEHLMSSFFKRSFLLGVALFSLAGMVYPVMAIPSRTAGFRGPPNLDGAANIEIDHPEDWTAIKWIQENLGLEENKSDNYGMPVILEAIKEVSYNSYSYEGRVSTFTGFPTVLGWSGHEYQWRGNYIEQGEREQDITMIYSTTDPTLMLNLLHKWGVDYVVVSVPEQNYIQELCSDAEYHCNARAAMRKFDLALKTVFVQDEVKIYRVP